LQIVLTDWKDDEYVAEYSLFKIDSESAKYKRNFNFLEEYSKKKHRGEIILFSQKFTTTKKLNSANTWRIRVQRVTH
jgi:uncharacterized protein (UPF0332 family)